MKLRAILTATPLALLLALPVAAQPYGAGGGGHHWRSATRSAQGMHGPRGGGLLGPQMVQFLQLTQDQITQAKALLANLRQQAAPLRDQMKQNRQQLLQQLSSTSPDPSAVGKLVLEQKSLRQQLQDMRKNGADEFAKLLTSEQQARFETLRLWWQSRPRPGGQGPQGPAS